MKINWRTSIGSVWLLLVLGALCGEAVVESCNQELCASIVSKCMLTQSCKCDIKECTCCKDCINCLGSDYYDKCCSCVEMCPGPTNTTVQLSQRCHVEDFVGHETLFNAFVFPKPLSDGDAYTYEVDIDSLLVGSKKGKNIKYAMKSSETNIDGDGDGDGDRDGQPQKQDKPTSVNCTVFFLPDCMPWTKCQNICRSAGSSAYRWFHNGCCECVGFTCINYGINQSRCRKCLGDESLEDDDLEDVDEFAQDYGDGIGPMDGTVGNDWQTNE